MSLPNRAELVYEAKLSEQVERFDDMMEKMTEVVVTFKDQSLSVEERNLLSVAFKNVIGAKRASWRILTSLENKLDEKDEQKKNLLISYKKQVEKELNETSNRIVSLIDEHLLEKDSEKPNDPESKIFYLKMKGDYKRYLAEFCSGDEKKDASNASCEAYKSASELANDQLSPTHPIRLGLALNFSVFYYEIQNDPDRACRLAKAAFDDAIAELDKLNEESYKDSTLIMQLLRDNLTLWTSDIDGDGDGDGDVELEDVEGKGGE